MCLNIIKVSIFLLIAVTLGACGSSQGTLQVVEETPVSADDSESRMTPVGKEVTLKDGEAKSFTVEESKEPFFLHIASAEAPVDADSNQRLQATNFAVYDSLAVVTYAMAGETVRGAIDFIDIKELQKPRIISTIHFKDAEFSDIVISEKYAYLVGANINGALLHIRTISPAEKSVAIASLELPGFYATHIQKDGNYLWISSGNNMGVLKVDISKPEKPEVVQKIELSNALSTVKIGKRLFALGGEKTSLFRFDDPKISLLQNISDLGIEAPGRLAATNKLVATNVGSSGLSVFQLSKGELKNVSHTDLKGTGNGIDIHLSFAFLAQGEAGLMVVSLLIPSKPFYLGRFDFEDDSGSANQIRIGHKLGSLPIAFVADGRGGFKIISIKV